MPSEKKVLNALVDGEKTFRELAEFFKVDEENKIMTRPALNTALKNLISKGFVQIVLNTQGKKAYKLQPKSYIQLFFEEFSKINLYDYQEYLIPISGVIAFSLYKGKLDRWVYRAIIEFVTTIDFILEKNAIEKLEPEERKFYFTFLNILRERIRKEYVKQKNKFLRNLFEQNFQKYRKKFPLEVARFMAVKKVKYRVEYIVRFNLKFNTLILEWWSKYHNNNSIMQKLFSGKISFTLNYLLSTFEKKEIEHFCEIEKKLESLLPKAVILIPFNFPEIDNFITNKMIYMESLENFIRPWKYVNEYLTDK